MNKNTSHFFSLAKWLFPLTSGRNLRLSFVFKYMSICIEFEKKVFAKRKIRDVVCVKSKRKKKIISHDFIKHVKRKLKYRMKWEIERRDVDIHKWNFNGEIRTGKKQQKESIKYYYLKRATVYCYKKHRERKEEKKEKKNENMGANAPQTLNSNNCRLFVFPRIFQRYCTFVIVLRTV